jgi:type IV pilus assembly protein PilE
MKNQRTTGKGFSLIELLIAITIVAIIFSIAIPSWKTYLQTMRRTEAVALLMELANRQENFRIQQHRYAATKELTVMPPEGLGIINSNARYALTTIASAHEYTAFATVDTSGTQADDKKCWEFGVNEAGQRWSKSAAGDLTTTRCWRG